MIGSFGVGIDVHVVCAGVPGKRQGVANPDHQGGIGNSDHVYRRNDPVGGRVCLGCSGCRCYRYRCYCCYHHWYRCRCYYCHCYRYRWARWCGRGGRCLLCLFHHRQRQNRHIHVHSGVAMTADITSKANGFSSIKFPKRKHGGIACGVTDQDLVGGIARIGRIGVGIDVHVVCATRPNKYQRVLDPDRHGLVTSFVCLRNDPVGHQVCLGSHWFRFLR